MTIPTTPLTYNSYVSQVATMAVVQTDIFGGTIINATSLVAGSVYIIHFVGTTDFILVGAASNSVGAIFTATASGTGTGTVASGGVVAGVDDAFNFIIPQMLNYAELRIQRDLDIQNLTVVSNTYSLTQNSNTLSIDVNDFVTIETVGIVSGTTTYPALPSTKEYIQNVYANSSYTGIPETFCMYGGDSASTGATSATMLFGPYADNTYQITLTGLARMNSLYYFATPAAASTSYTLISLSYPDLLIMASMIYISSFQRNFGKINDDPQMAVTYESQYQALLRSSMAEEYRKKFEGADGTAYSQSPLMAPRG